MALQREVIAVPRSSIKDEKTYRKLRTKGESKEKAARIMNKRQLVRALRNH